MAIVTDSVIAAAQVAALTRKQTGLPVEVKTSTDPDPEVWEVDSTDVIDTKREYRVPPKTLTIDWSCIDAEYDFVFLRSDGFLIFTEVSPVARDNRDYYFNEAQAQVVHPDLLGVDVVDIRPFESVVQRP